MTSILQQAGQDVNPNGMDMQETQPEIESVRVGDLTVDHSYQRGINPKQVAKFAVSFDPMLFGIPIIHRRADDRMVILDGQHRIEAVKELHGPYWTIQAQVHSGLSLEQEAYLFYRYNGERLRVGAKTIWHAALLAGDPEILRLNEILTRHGVRVTHESERENKPGILNAPATFREVAKPRMATRGGGLDYDHVERVVTLLMAAWGDTKDALQSDMLKGMDAFLRRYGAQIDEKRLIECTVRDGANDVRQRSSTIKTSFRLDTRRAVGMAILASYNHGRRKRLPDWSTRE